MQYLLSRRRPYYPDHCSIWFVYLFNIIRVSRLLRHNVHVRVCSLDFTSCSLALANTGSLLGPFWEEFWHKSVTFLQVLWLATFQYFCLISSPVFTVLLSQLSHHQVMGELFLAEVMNRHCLININLLFFST